MKLVEYVTKIDKWLNGALIYILPVLSFLFNVNADIIAYMLLICEMRILCDIMDKRSKYDRHIFALEREREKFLDFEIVWITLWGLKNFIFWGMMLGFCYVVLNPLIHKIHTFWLNSLFIFIPNIYEYVNTILSRKILFSCKEENRKILGLLDIANSLVHILIFLLFAFFIRNKLFYTYTDLIYLAYLSKITGIVSVCMMDWGKKANRHFLENGLYTFCMKELREKGVCILEPSYSYVISRWIVNVGGIIRYVGLAEIGFVVFNRL